MCTRTPDSTHFPLFFNPTQALVHQECVDIIRTVEADAAGNDKIAEGAMNIIMGGGNSNMDAYSTLLGRFATITRNSLHMTAPQASFFVFAYIATMITYIPEIKCQQMWIILLGGSDTGKSAVMNLVGTVLPDEAVGAEDSQSKCAVTSNGQYKVRITDEQRKWGFA
jgi:hypothetical protein